MFKKGDLVRYITGGDLGIIVEYRIEARLCDVAGRVLWLTGRFAGYSFLFANPDTLFTMFVPADNLLT